MGRSLLSNTNEKYVFDLKLPSGYRSLDEVTQVSVSVSGENLAERLMDVSEIMKGA